MFSKYEQNGIHLAYPENWHLSEEASGEARLQLSITSPDTAFWTLAVYGEMLDPGSLASQALEALKGEYPDAESLDVDQDYMDLTLSGYDVNFICLDLTITAMVRAFIRKEESYLVLAQVEDRELEHASAVFEAILVSLLNDPKS